MNYYERIAQLPLTVEAFHFEAHELSLPSGNNRVTTEFVLSGLGHEGRGEDVNYETADQLVLQNEGHTLPLTFSGTFGEYSQHISATDTFPQPPTREDYRNYRQWAIESAALDLALRQADTSIDALLGIELSPVRFIMSLRLGSPPSMQPVNGWLAVAPDLEFKIDAESSWPRGLMQELAATGRVQSIDLKGFYSGTPVDNPPEPVLYAAVVELFPDAWIEDPALTEMTRPILEPAIKRFTWDAPIHSVADIEALEYPPLCINIKPSRFGPVSALLAAIEYCQQHDIEMYSGGQYELGVGRGHLHVVASLFFPDSPNDAAPVEYHAPQPVAGVPQTPLAPPAQMHGFRW